MADDFGEPILVEFLGGGSLLLWNKTSKQTVTNFF